MRCPECGGRTRVRHTRNNARERVCLECPCVFKTRENLIKTGYHYPSAEKLTPQNETSAKQCSQEERDGEARSSESGSGEGLREVS
jgi:hypothetical protein